MLEIITNGVKLDLTQDTSITIQYDNPLFESNGIPTPFSFTYSLPLTTRNLATLCNPDRVPSNVDYAKRLATTIRFAGMDITSGYQTIESTSDEDIEVSFNSMIFPEASKLHLQNLPLQKFDFGTAVKVTDPISGAQVWNTNNAANEYLRIMTEQIAKPIPDFVAVMMAVKGVNVVPPTDLVPSDIRYLNQRTMRVNHYHSNIYSAKIIPSIRVGYLLKMVLGEVSGVFDSGDFSKLLLMCSYHPSYQVQDDARVWNVDKTNGKVTLSLADFLPDISFEDFVCEILKLPCASMFIVNDKLIIASNSAIIRSNNIVDWSNMIVGYPAIGVELGSHYEFGYADIAPDEAIPAEREIYDVATIKDMVLPSITIDGEQALQFVGNTIHVKDANQTYVVAVNEALSDDTHFHFDYNLVSDTIEVMDDISDDNRGSFDMTFNGSPVRMVVGVDVGHDNDMVPSFDRYDTKHHYIYCPEVDFEDTPNNIQRPNKIVVGLYHGMDNSIIRKGATFNYPSVGRSNWTAWGGLKGETSLNWNGYFGLISKHHTEYKAWIEKDKRTIKADVLLSSVDLRNLDLRKKCHINGRNFLIKSLSVTLTSTVVKPAEVEFVEA